MSAIRLGWSGVRGYGLRFWEAVRSSPELAVSACHHPDFAVAREAGERMGAAPFADFDAMLASGVDAVALFVPNELHFDLARRALKAGKHVLVEKPLTNAAAEGEELVRLAAEKGLVLAVGHNYRRSGHVRAMKRAIDAGRIGRVVAAELRMGHGGAMRFEPRQWRYHRERCPGGPLNMLGSHLIDAANYLLGTPVAASGSVRRLAAPTTAEDTSLVRVDYASGASAHVLNLYASVSTESIDVYGTEGALRWSRWPDNALSLQPKDVGLAPGPLEALPFEETNGQRELLEEFVRACRGEGRHETDGAAGLLTVRVIEAALESSRESRTVPIAAEEPAHA